MKTQFTPGPWFAEPEDIVTPDVPCIPICAGKIGPTFYKIAEVCSQLDEETDDFRMTEIDQANAHLIASAPELYDLVDLLASVLVNAVDPNDFGKILNEKVLPVLKKARGEEL